MKSGSRETEPAEPVPFSQSETVDGVVIKVEADAGVFPPDAVLSVSRVSDAVQEAAEEAVEEVLDEGRNLGLSYTFDIKILDADGEELQPEDGDLVRVSFALERVSDPNLEAAVYHVTEAEEGNTRSELIAEELDVRVDEVNEIITAESDGFSNYSVVFTYDDMGYEFRNVGYGGNYTEDIRDIVSVCGLTGEIQHASVSDDNYLTVSHLNGNWSITVKEFFWSTQTLTVTIGGVDYDINLIAVPDGAEIPYIDEEGYLKNCFVYEVYDGALNIPGGWWAITGQSPSDINNRVVIDGDVHLIVADDLTVSFNEGIHVREGSTLTIYGQIRQNGTLCATGSKNGAGIGGSENALGGRIIIYGATVKATGGKKGSLAVTKSPYPQQLSAGDLWDRAET